MYEKEDDVIAKMLSSKAEKVFHSASRKRGVFRETSYVKELLVKLKDHSITFETFSQKLAQYVFDKRWSMPNTMLVILLWLYY